MKNLFEYGFVIGLGLLFCACHDNDGEMDLPVTPEEPGEVADMPEIDGKVYSAGDNFVLYGTVNGSGGDIWDYNMNLEEGQHAQISFDGESKGIIKFYTDNFDLSSIEGNPVKGEVARPSFVGFGQEIPFPVEFVPDYSKGRYKFSGNQIISGVKISVSDGVISSDGLDAHLYFLNVGAAMSNLVHMVDLPEYDDNYHYTSSTFVVDMYSPEYPKEIEEIISLSDLIQVLLNAPLIKESAYGFNREIDRDISISTLWGRLIPGFFFPSHSSRAIYPLSFKIYEVYGDVQLYFTGHIQYPYNAFCASDYGESTYRLYIDPVKVFKVNILKGKTDDRYEKYSLSTPALYSLLSNVFLALTPDNAEGILMDYKNAKENDEYKFKTTFSDRMKGLAVLKSILLTIFSDSSAIENLKNSLVKGGMDAKTLSAVIYVAENLENILNNASGATFGWSYTSYFYTDYSIGQYYYEKLYEN